MIDFYLVDSSNDSIAIAILAFAITTYLLTLKTKQKSTWMFMLFFLFQGLFVLRNAFHGSLMTYSLLPFTEMGMLLLYISLFFFVPFSLYYHKPFNKIAGRILMGFSITMLVSITAISIKLALQNPWKVFQFGSDQFFFKNIGAIVGISATVYVLIPIIVLLKKAVNYSEVDGNIIKKLLSPKGRFSSACRNFALAIMLQFSLGLIGVFAYMDIVDYAIIKNLQILLTLLLYFSYVLLYLNNSQQPTTFMVKIVGISLFTVLILFTTFGTLIVNYERNNYDTSRLVPHHI